MGLFQASIFLVLVASAFSAEPAPCYNLDHPHYSMIGNCIPSSVCSSNVTFPDLCDGYPTDYTCCFDDKYPGREGRGAWIATVQNIDWPTRIGESSLDQITALNRYVEIFHEININAVYFQVRPHGDALFLSDIEPWSRYLTGTEGQAPSPLYDPLTLMIESAHAKNIAVHVWINPYRANMRPTTEDLHPMHMAKKFPTCAYPYGTFLWMDPGCPLVQDQTYNVALDLVKRYDIDGIHMDDYFYPYPVAGVPFPDDKTYADSGSSLPLDDWRRENVNKLVERLHIGIQAEKPWVQFTVSPFGIYRAGFPTGMPSPPISGFDQYKDLYADPLLWYQEGWVDVIQPQLYWRIDPPAQSYPILLDWWVGKNTAGRHFYAGQYTSKLVGNEWNITEIGRQIEISRQAEHRRRGSWGNIQFSAKVFRDNVQGAVEYFRNNIYQYPALQPPMPWLVPRPNKI